MSGQGILGASTIQLNVLGSDREIDWFVQRREIIMLHRQMKCVPTFQRLEFSSLVLLELKRIALIRLFLPRKLATEISDGCSYNSRGRPSA